MHVVFPHCVKLIFVSHRLIEIEEVFMVKFYWLPATMSQDFNSHCICVKDSQVLALILLHHIVLIVISGHVDVTSEYQHLS